MIWFFIFIFYVFEDFRKFDIKIKNKYGFNNEKLLFDSILYYLLNVKIK